MADSYVCSQAKIKCSYGDKIATLIVLPDRTIWLTGRPMANISDHTPLKNITPFGRCHTTAYPPTGAATAAAHGKLTPMPCIPNTPFPWMGGKNNVVLKCMPALLKSSKCKCIYGGTITIVDDGQSGQSATIVGAQPVEPEEFSCVMHKVSCTFTDDKGQQKNPVLYERDKYVAALTASETDEADVTEENGTLFCGIMVYDEFCERYLITNHKGKELDFSCEREVNACHDSSHEYYHLDYTDIDTRKTVSLRRHISDGKHTLRYYNIFNRGAKYARASVAAMPLTPVAPAIGALAGDAMDAICALRFILLPRISPDDEENYCYALLDYMECPHAPGIPSIRFNIYPDIKFEFEINGLGRNTERKGGKTSFEKTPFGLEFSVSFADTKHKLEFEISDDKTLTDEERKGLYLYRAIRWLAEFCSDAGDLASAIGEEIEKASKKTNKYVAPVVKATGKTVDFAGDVAGGAGNLIDKGGKSINKAFSACRWLEGSFSIGLNFGAKWSYLVKNDMSELRRHLELQFGGNAEGKLTINLVELASIMVDKTKKATTVAAGVAAVGSGGLAAVPALLLKLLVDYVVTWLKDKIKEGLKFNLIFSAGVDAQAISYDSEREQKVEFAAVTISPGIKLELGVHYKTSITYLLKVKGEAKAMTEAETTLDTEIKFNRRTGVFGVDIETVIKPFSIRIYYQLSGSYEIFGLSKSTSRGSDVFTYETKECKMPPKRIDFFKTKEEKGGTNGGGETGGGGGGGVGWDDTSAGKTPAISPNGGGGGGGW